MAMLTVVVSKTSNLAGYNVRFIFSYRTYKMKQLQKFVLEVC